MERDNVLFKILSECNEFLKIPPSLHEVAHITICEILIALAQFQYQRGLDTKYIDNVINMLFNIHQKKIDNGTDIDLKDIIILAVAIFHTKLLEHSVESIITDEDYDDFAKYVCVLYADLPDKRKLDEYLLEVKGLIDLQ